MADELGVWIRRLAVIERPSASEGERRAAEWVLSEVRSAGIEARIEVERAHGTHLPFVLPSAVAFAPGLLRRRSVGGLPPALATPALVDQLGARLPLLRRILARRWTYHFVAQGGGH